MRENSGEQYTFAQTHKTNDILTLIEGGSEGSSVAVGGRVLGMREHGQLAFADIHDEFGQIQAIASAELTPEFDTFKATNVGDWIGVEGQAGKSKRGEPSIFISDWRRLAQTEVPFPDKRKGLTDTETVYRQRYLDLAVNDESMQRFITRSRIVSGIRSHLDGLGFVEVETPILQTVYGGAAARPFETHHNALDTELYLRIAPELYLKRLVVGGMQRVYEIGKVFRNEGISTRHNPEFTMMEVYGAFWDYQDQMSLTEDLVARLTDSIHGTTEIAYQGREVDLSTPWRRATMDELVSEAIDEEVSVATGTTKLRKLCEENDITFEPDYGPGKLLLELYEKTVEGGLWGPIFVTDYPKEVSPLARDHRSRPEYTERFEGIVAGRELCNGYTELNEAREQYFRFLDQEGASKYDDEAMPMDYDYVRALKYGMPPTAGMGIGIDRLAMLLTDTNSIKDVILFPTQRPDGYTTSYPTD